jgi:hypothetical protein
MGLAYEDDVDNISKKQLHKIRPSYYNQAHHCNDVFLNMGYDYRGNILKNGTSPELWSNPQQIGMYGKLEGILVYLIESTKLIKKCFSIAHSKDTSNIN